jgi:hypothetical protein
MWENSAISRGFGKKQETADSLQNIKIRSVPHFWQKHFNFSLYISFKMHSLNVIEATSLYATKHTTF